jgi:hypothetical protein
MTHCPVFLWVCVDDLLVCDHSPFLGLSVVEELVLRVCISEIVVGVCCRLLQDDDKCACSSSSL